MRVSPTRPNSSWITWTNCQINGKCFFRPNVACYSALIWAYAKVGNTAQSEAVFARMIQDMKGEVMRGGDKGSGIDPTQFNSQVWTGVLASWAESKDPNSAQIILGVMERLRRCFASKELQGMLDSKSGDVVFSTLTYNVLLSCYARQTHNVTAGAREGEKLFEWMQQQETPMLQPDGASYFNMIQAWANAKVPERCEYYLQILQEDMDRGKVSGPNALRVDHFNLVIEAWAQSGRPDAMDKMRDILDKMKQGQIRPDVVTYNCYLWALARAVKTG